MTQAHLRTPRPVRSSRLVGPGDVPGGVPASSTRGGLGARPSARPAGRCQQRPRAPRAAKAKESTTPSRLRCGRGAASENAWECQASSLAPHARAMRNSTGAEVCSREAETPQRWRGRVRTAADVPEREAIGNPRGPSCRESPRGAVWWWLGGNSRPTTRRGRGRPGSGQGRSLGGRCASRSAGVSASRVGRQPT